MKKTVEEIKENILVEVENQFPGILLHIQSYNIITIPKDKALGVYSIRYNIILEQEDLHKTSSFKQTLDNLKNSQFEKISIHAFYNSTVLVLVFTDESSEIIIGMILFSSTTINLKEEVSRQF